METQEMPGEWWLPGSEKKVPGTLYVDEDGRTELRLIGSLKGMFDDAIVSVNPETGETTSHLDPNSGSGTYPRIHGRTGSKIVTLDNCIRKNQTFRFGGIDAEYVHVHQVISNAHFDAEDELEFDWAKVRMNELIHFVSNSGIAREIKFKDKTEGGGGIVITGHEVRVANVPDASFVGPNGEELTIRHEYAVRDGVEEHSFTQDFSLVATTSELRDLDSFLKLGASVQALVTIATGRVAEFKDVSFRRSDVAREIDGHAWPIDMPLTASWAVRAQKGAKRPTNLDAVFTLGEFGGTDSLENWLVVAKNNESTLARVMATKYSSGSYAADGFFGCAAAIEAYDRDKHSDDIHYVERVKRCITYAGTQYQAILGDTTKFAEAVRDNRNNVAHHNQGISDASMEVFVLGKACFWLYIFCLLRDAGAPEMVLDKLCDQSAVAALKSQLDELLG